MTPRKIFVRTSLICLFLIVALFAVSVKKIDRYPISAAAPTFNGEDAFQYMSKLAKGFPGRMTFTDARKQAALWLKSELRSMGYQPKGMKFSEVIDGKEYTDLENIYAEKRGTEFPDQIIVLSAHYDTPETTNEGAMDDASGVGVVLEMAKLLSKVETKRTVVFLLTDSEEFGALWGAINFTRQYEKMNQVIANLNFDFVGMGDQVAILTLPDGLKEGYAALWLREMALDSIRSFGEVEALDLTNVSEHILRALLIPAGDHGAFLAAGVPAFNWVGQMRNFPMQMGYYHHSVHDTVEEMKPAAFWSYGKAAERLLYSIDELKQLPPDWRDGNYWKISRHLYLPGGITLAIHILAFFPFLALSIARISEMPRKYSRRQIRTILINELKHFAILFVSLLAGYGMMQLLPALRIITQYEAFPATQKSAVLYSPNLLAVLLVVGVVAAAYLIFLKIFQENEDSDRALEIRHTVHLAVVTLVIILGFVKNSFLATLLLLPVAYFWAAMRTRRKVEDRILNTLLILAGTSVLIALAVFMRSIFHIGVVYWYVFLAATYGLISAYTVVLAFMVIAVLIRLVRKFVI